ncbi:MAG: NAD(P)-dependent dehydrogenase (short-subunit alcohol dehydrogenase family) [Enterobacterales bacterium]|jgi:NAD(P)-dependent dehydrogenase (short-subunit alcohol dehydrogenase family)
MQNNVVVITGGNRGIGLDITETFINAGYKVIVGARQDFNLEQRFGENLSFLKTDVRNEQAHQKLVEYAHSKYGGLNVFINNAGFSEWMPIEEIENEFLDDIINTNIKGVFWGCKVAANTMLNGGSIINISSLAGKRGSTNNSAYCATKFAVNGITQSLAKELGPKGIRVNALCPVLIKTDGLVEALKGIHSPAKGQPEEFIDNFSAANSALGRLPTGHEVGKMCLSLASDNMSAITGQCINVDCGVFPQ